MGDLRHPSIRYWLRIELAAPENPNASRSPSDLVEFGVRAALGAKRSHIVRQVLIESTVLACCGGVIGIALAFVVLKTFQGLAPVDIPRLTHVQIDGIVLAVGFFS